MDLYCEGVVAALKAMPLIIQSNNKPEIGLHYSLANGNQIENLQSV